ncbi:hypothetical protein BCR35DRAFT_304147 [Leucosporidium creatinivorum]|uniref:Proteophosphoglycan 5 n=1 Tax=Leucosporidium creatinivorum TaxID=106004 RepID=A0A1Y2FCY3_9BASI|nr:hypothetical protein BCR35DRAFT_304147 [Leucosporidium creatinivorum]
MPRSSSVEADSSELQDLLSHRQSVSEEPAMDWPDEETRGVSALNRRARAQTSWRAMLSALMGIALLLLLGASYTLGRRSARADAEKSERGHDSTPAVQRLLIRPWADNEGLGSVLQLLKIPIVIAERVANATFWLSETESIHHYSSSHLYNARYFNSTFPLGKTCLLSHYLPIEDRLPLVRAVCQPDSASSSFLTQAADLGRRLAPCAIIIDDAPHEVHQDLNGCISHFSRERLGGINQRRLGDSKAVSVGVHIRWGDSARPGQSHFRGSMDLEHINTIVRDAQARYQQLDVRVAMENHTATVLDKLEFAYTLVDGDDDLGDLKLLADSDLLLVGSSSYGALAHLLAPKGLTVVEGNDLKYKNTPRKFVLFDDYTSSSLKELDRILGWSTRRRELGGDE